MLVFLTPLGGLLALAAVLPVAAALLRERRLAGVRRALGLASPGRRVFASALAAAASVALLAVAAAQPALSRTRALRQRVDAQAYVLLDNSRSMEAVSRRGGPTRFARAQRLALRLRDALPTVAWGVASFSDRALVHVFPTTDGHLFAAAVEQSVGIERPAPGYQAKTATGFGGLVEAAGGFFLPSTRERLVVLFTDGESRPFSPTEVAALLRRHGVRLVLVRLWSPHDRVYGAHGRDLGYRPDASSVALLAKLRAAGIPVVPERDFSAVPELARRLLGSGRTVAGTKELALTPLAPLAILAAVVPVGFLLARSRR